MKSVISSNTSLSEAVWPLSGARADYDPLLDRIGNSKFVLLGEASHGTHEFYWHRAEITKRLILDKPLLPRAPQSTVRCHHSLRRNAGR